MQQCAAPAVATGVGFIALAGMVAEFGVVILAYLEQAIAARLDDGLALTSDMLVEGIREDAVLRVRPKAMTVAVIVGGLLPIFAGSGAGSEVMSRIAAPSDGRKRHPENPIWCWRCCRGSSVGHALPRLASL